MFGHNRESPRQCVANRAFLREKKQVSDFEAKHVVKEFDSAGGSIRILDDVSVALDRGQNLAVVGPSGSGKSTFLHIAGTLDQPSSGSVLLQGQDPAGLKEGELAKFRNHKIGFVFQEHHLLPQLTALQNVLIPVVANGPASSESINRAESLLESVGLQDRQQHRPAMLSGGERQRVAVARALICDPVLLLADEPTGSLDQKNADAIGQLLLELQSDNNAILICVTHSEKLAGRFSQRVRVDNGKFV